MRSVTAAWLIALAAISMVAFAENKACDKPAPTKAVSELVLPTAETASLDNKHFVMKWLVLGPFTFAEADFGGDQQQASIDKEFITKEGDLDGTQEAPKGTKWVEKDFSDSGTTGCVDLDAQFDSVEHAAAYAVCWLNCPEALSDLKVLGGCDDYMKVWVNGKLVLTYNKERRAGEADQDTATGVSLEKGINRIVVKCSDVVMGWNFYLRFTDKSGKAIVVKPAAK